MINCDIPGWKSKDDLLELEKILDKISNDCTIVEVGSGFGRATWVMAATKPLAIIYAIDVWTGWDPSPYLISCEGIIPQDNFYCTMEWFNYYISNFDNVISIKNKSPLTSWSYKEIDLLYLDAEHKYEIVLSHLNFWKQFMKPDAIYAGHDYGPGSEKKHAGVRKAVDHFARDNNKTVIQERGWTWYLI